MNSIKEKLEMRRMGRVGLVLAAIVGLAACGPAQADGPEDGPDGEGFVRVINVEVADVATQGFTEEIRLTSVAVANQDVTVSAEESGVIRELFVDKGARVQAGDPIAKIDDAVLVAQVAQARAQASLATQTWERRKRLFEEDQVGSEIVYLQAKYGAEQAQANLDVLEERLARTTVRAPFAGVLEERSVEVGSMVSPGQAVGRLVDLNPVKVMAGVPERYAPDVALGAIASFTFDVLGDEVFTAPVRYVGSTVEPASRTFLIEVSLPNPGQRIKPQMVANMAVTRRQVDEAVVVPQDALVRVEDGYVVFVAAERGGYPVAEVRRVTLGPARRNFVVIESGIDVGDRLIVVGQKSVADGDRVSIVAEHG